MKELCNFIMKEEGICIYRVPEEPKVPRDLALLDYQIHNIRSDYDRWQEYEEALKQAQSSAILCEDQERATELIIKLHYPDLVPVADRLDLEIGSIYPVPGIEFEILPVSNYNIPDDLNKSATMQARTVARIIEHTAEKEETLQEMDDKFAEAAKRVIDKAPSKTYKLAESPEIDKEEDDLIAEIDDVVGGIYFHVSIYENEVVVTEKRGQNNSIVKQFTRKH